MAAVTPSINGSGWTWAQWLAKGTVGHLEALITANLAGTAAPTAVPTVAVSGSGGLLAAGTYYLRITETNGLGETTASPESAQFTVTAGQIPTVTFPTLQAGNTARNVYLSPGGGATGTEALYETGITTGTATLAIAAPTGYFAMSPPGVNTTGLTWVDMSGVTNNERLVLLRKLRAGNAQDVWSTWHQDCSNFAAGSRCRSLRSSRSCAACSGCGCCCAVGERNHGVRQREPGPSRGDRPGQWRRADAADLAVIGGVLWRPMR